MSSTVLIDAIVRQTTVLLANLATSSGHRTTLASVANQVFADLVRELKQQGLGNKVIADMFGLALRTYHKRVARASESRSLHGQSMWEAVLSFVQQHGTALRADVLARFSADEEAVVRGVLTDLVDSGLLFRTGTGDRTSYRAALPDELPALPERRQTLTLLVMVALHQRGPLGSDELADIVPADHSELSSILDELVADERAQCVDVEGGVGYRCEHVFVGYREPAGWEAAVYDHYQAVVGALCHKLRRSLNQAHPDETVGGSTYSFDLWPGHPFEREALGLLAKLRREVVALRERVEAYNQAHVAERRDDGFRVVTYLGQNTVGHDEEMDHDE